MRLILFAISLFAVTGYAQINWVPIEDLEDSLAVKPKPVYVFIHTSWCGYCKMMKLKVFADEGISKKLNEDYYCVSIDAETKDTLEYAGTKYPSTLQPNGTWMNSLARQIGEVNDKMSYPTNVFLTEQLVIQQQYPTYLKKGDFRYVLKTLTK